MEIFESCRDSSESGERVGGGVGRGIVARAELWKRVPFPLGALLGISLRGLVGSWEVVILGCRVE